MLNETDAAMILKLLSLYFLVGFLFGIYFAFSGGAGRIDPSFKNARFFVRLIVLWAALALWPYLTWRVFRAKKAAGLHFDEGDEK